MAKYNRKSFFLSGMKPYILLSSAIKEEIEGVIKRLQNPVTSFIAKRETISGNINEQALKIVVTGPCMANTVHAITAVIENMKPVAIIQSGCAGVFRQKGLKSGDICIAENEIDAQLGIESRSKIKELPFALHKIGKKEVKGLYPTDPDLRKFAEKVLNEKFTDDTNIKTGNFITVSTITATEKRSKKLYKDFDAYMENMEGAAAAYIAMLYGIPFCEIRCGSNIVGKREPEKWDLEGAFKKNSKAVYELIKRIAN